MPSPDDTNCQHPAQPPAERDNHTGLYVTVAALALAHIILMALCGAYLAWQHPRAAAPINTAATLLGGIGALAAPLVAVALARRR